MSVLSRTPEGSGSIDLGRTTDFALGPLKIRPSTCEVEAGERREIMQPKAMQVLVALARAEGAVVSRDRLIDECWDGRVVGEDAINRAVAKVRAIADLTGPPAFEVETIPRVGFRLKASEALSASTTPFTDLPIAPQAEVPAQALPFARARSLLIAASLAIVALLGGLLFAWLRSPVGPAAPQPAFRTADASIAVLPFLNMSGDPAKEYFSDGFSEELLNDLANTPQLRVAARTSSFSFKGKNADIHEIARKLNVRTVLEGSVRESGDHVRITAQLIDAQTGYHVWSQAYDRGLGDILRLQDEIAHAITASLVQRLLPVRASPVARIRPEAYRAFLQGKFHFDRRTDPDNRAAIALFQQATALQPDFAEAYAMLGYARLQEGRAHVATLPAEETRQLESALRRALELDTNNITALYVSLHLSLARQDWNDAGNLLRRLSAINPGHPLAVRAAAFYYDTLGLQNRALPWFELATRLDPLSAAAWQSLVATLLEAGKSQEAIQAGEAAAALKLEGAYLKGELCAAYAADGRMDAANTLETHIAADDRASLLYCRFQVAMARRDLGHARAIADVFAVEAEALNVDSESVAELYIQLGADAKAIPWLDRAFTVNGYALYSLASNKQLPRIFFQSKEWKEIAQRPAFRAWQAAHDRLAAQLAAEQ
jgi:TolB-like protein/DNA-binding winged helix-turn-helix (wHTH) protein/lipoprotein NlpI